VDLPGLWAHDTLMARGRRRPTDGLDTRNQREPLTGCFAVERVTGIEPALSAWELYGAARLRPGDSVTCEDLAGPCTCRRMCLTSGMSSTVTVRSTISRPPTVRTAGVPKAFAAGPATAAPRGARVKLAGTRPLVMHPARQRRAWHIRHLTCEENVWSG
jgi:hypothetical protein